MTRRDLEEVILNLEYLVLHDFDGRKIKEYEDLLQAFRQEFQALTQQQSLAATVSSSHQHRWLHWLQR